MFQKSISIPRSSSDIKAHNIDFQCFANAERLTSHLASLFFNLPMLLTTCDNKTHTPHPRVASFLYSWIQGPTFPDVLTCPCFWLQCFANAERLTSHLASLFFNLPMLLTICDNKTHTTHPCVASFLYSRIQGPIFPDVLTVLLKDRLIFSMRFALPTDPRVASYLYPYKGSLKKKKKFEGM